MVTAYKIHASILNERMKKEIERKLAEGQFGFRAGRRAIDAIYVLNYMINKELSMKRGKLFTCFVNLKVAFDKVDRRALMERLKEMDIEGNLRRRITEIQRNRQHGENRGEENRKLLDNKRSETTPLSPIFFNAFLSDLEKDMSKVQEEEVMIG